MPKPTTRDLAAAAGVSLATVDRVLNGRDGVRKPTVEKVNAAILQIGFVRDMAAATLARGKQYTFAFVLPDRTDAFAATIAEAVTRTGAAMIQDRIVVRLIRVRANDPHDVVRTIIALAEEGIDGIAVMAPETALARDAINRARRRGLAVVTFVSDQPSADRDRFVGINDVAAGRTAATLIGRFSQRRRGTVMVVAETILSRDSLDRRRGFDEIMVDAFPNLATTPTLETWADPDRTVRVLGLAMSWISDLRAVYLMGSGMDAAMDALAGLATGSDCVVVAHELTKTTRPALSDGRLSAVIHQDVGHLVRSALRVLRAKADRTLPNESQERIRIEIMLRSNLPADEAWE